MPRKIALRWRRDFVHPDERPGAGRCTAGDRARLDRSTRGGTRPPPPRTLILEPTAGCVHRCDGCGISSIRQDGEGAYQFMRLGLVDKIVSSMRIEDWYDTAIVFSGRGEPTLNERLEDLVRRARQTLPLHPIMVETSLAGYRDDFLPARLGNLLTAGATMIAVNCSPETGALQMIHDNYEAIVRLVGCELIGYPELPVDGRQHVEPPRRVISCVTPDDPDAYDSRLRERRKANLGACGGPPNTDLVYSACERPFTELSVRADGRVAICRNDWRGVVKMGDLNTDRLSDLWNSIEFDAVRRELFVDRTKISICRTCDSYYGNRRSFPDKKGRIRVPPPDSVTRAIAERCQSGRPYDRPVPLPWE